MGPTNVYKMKGPTFIQCVVNFSTQNVFHIYIIIHFRLIKSYQAAKERRKNVGAFHQKMKGHAIMKKNIDCADNATVERRYIRVF